MGTADKIAITRMVIAKNFAMLRPPGGTRHRAVRLLRSACFDSLKNGPAAVRLVLLLLGLECEVCRCRLSPGHCDLLRLRAEGFLPGGQSVVSRRQVLD